MKIFLLFQPCTNKRVRIPVLGLNLRLCLIKSALKLSHTTQVKCEVGMNCSPTEFHATMTPELQVSAYRVCSEAESMVL